MFAKAAVIGGALGNLLWCFLWNYESNIPLRPQQPTSPKELTRELNDIKTSTFSASNSNGCRRCFHFLSGCMRPVMNSIAIFTVHACLAVLRSVQAFLAVLLSVRLVLSPPEDLTLVQVKRLVGYQTTPHLAALFAP
jgi:hypothetical protein